MTGKLRELESHVKWLRQAASEIRRDGHNCWGNTCEFAADAIQSILDAEGDGVATAWQHREVVDGKPMEWQKCSRDTYLYWSTPENRSRGVAEVRELFHHPQPARSGVVSDEDVNGACGIYFGDLWPDEVEEIELCRVFMRAALERFAKSQGESNV
jgi:hypothetical protein